MYTKTAALSVGVGRGTVGAQKKTNTLGSGLRPASKQIARGLVPTLVFNSQRSDERGVARMSNFPLSDLGAS